VWAVCSCSCKTTGLDQRQLMTLVTYFQAAASHYCRYLLADVLLHRLRLSNSTQFLCNWSFLQLLPARSVLSYQCSGSVCCGWSFASRVLISPNQWCESCELWELEHLISLSSFFDKLKLLVAVKLYGNSSLALFAAFPAVTFFEGLQRDADALCVKLIMAIKTNKLRYISSSVEI